MLREDEQQHIEIAAAFIDVAEAAHMAAEAHKILAWKLMLIRVATESGIEAVEKRVQNLREGAKAQEVCVIDAHEQYARCSRKVGT